MQFNRRVDGAGGVVREQGRYFQRHPAVNTVSGVVNWPKKIGGLIQILQGQVEEHGLARLACARFVLNGFIVEIAVFDGVIEDRRVGGEPRHRQVPYVAAERAAGQKPAVNVVKPEALAQIVKLLCRAHVASIHPSSRLAPA